GNDDATPPDLLEELRSHPEVTRDYQRGVTQRRRNDVTCPAHYAVRAARTWAGDAPDTGLLRRASAGVGTDRLLVVAAGSPPLLGDPSHGPPLSGARARPDARARGRSPPLGGPRRACPPRRPPWPPRAPAWPPRGGPPAPPRDFGCPRPPPTPPRRPPRP